jgi:uncharacterized paraquat-inducible protein A
MAFELPPTVLLKLRNLFRSNPLQLTATESAIAQRIETCSACEYVWYRRLKKRPQRCPKCHSRAWDRPLIAALLEAHIATHPGEQKPNTQEAQE